MEALKFYPELTAWRKNKPGLCAITIRFDWHGNRVGNENLDMQVNPEHWGKESKEVLKADPSHEYKNLIILNRLNKHQNYFLRRKAFNLDITKDLVRLYLKNGALESVYDYAEHVIQNKKLADGKPYSEDSKRRYRDEIKRLLQYKAELSFKQLDYNFLVAYKRWLQHDYKKKDKKNLAENSIWKALGFIRMIYNEAVKDRIIVGDDNPFKKFEVGAFKTDMDKIKWLEMDEIEVFEKILISEHMPDLTMRIGWRFLAMCVSGLRISDAMSLNNAFFNDAGDLQITPHKTSRHGNKAQVPIISDRQRRYMQQTLALPLPPTDYKSFRTTFNIHLKVLAAMAGIKINLTSHVGRHTMGSFLVDAGVEKKAAMAMLGVKKETTIEVYMHLKESKLRTEAEKLKNIF